jgi:hypothetical protein
MDQGRAGAAGETPPETRRYRAGPSAIKMGVSATDCTSQLFTGPHRIKQGKPAPQEAKLTRQQSWVWLLGQDSNPSADGNSSADELTAALRVLLDPLPTPTAFQFSLAAHRLTPSWKRLLMYQPPGAGVTLSVDSAAIIKIVVL